jgi:L-asparaginase
MAHVSSGRPRIAVVGAGGSIAYRARFSLDLFEYADYGEMLSIEDLLDTVPELNRDFDVRAVPFRAIPSTGFGPADWLQLNELLHRILAEDPGINGIVVTHGTATLEETSYFLYLTLKTDLPVVLVGAQRPTGGISSDAPINLLNAVRAAAAPQCRGLGALVVLNDEIQSAREVTKGSTYRLETMRSPDLGMLGYVDPDGRVEIYRRPTRRFGTDSEFDARGIGALPRVDISYSYAGSDGVAIDAMVRAGAEAVVVASLAPGKTSSGEASAVIKARRRGVFIIQSSRAGSGRVLERTALREQGILAADNLNPQKARVLAMLGLTRSRDFEELQRMFRTY